MLVIVLVACCNLGWPVKATLISLIAAVGTNRARLGERVSAAVWSPTAIWPQVWAQECPQADQGRRRRFLRERDGVSAGTRATHAQLAAKARALPPCRPALVQAPRLTCGCRQHPRRPGHQHQGRRAQESEHGVGRPDQWLASPASSSGAVELERIPEQRGPLRDAPPLPRRPAPSYKPRPSATPRPLREQAARKVPGGPALNS